MLKLKEIEVFFHGWKITNDFNWGTIVFKLKKGILTPTNSKVLKIQDSEEYTYISVDTYTLDNISVEDIYGGAFGSILQVVLESIPEDKVIVLNENNSFKSSNDEDEEEYDDEEYDEEYEDEEYDEDNDEDEDDDEEYDDEEYDEEYDDEEYDN